MYKIIDNLVSAEEQNQLELSVLNDQTQWIFNRFAAYKSPAYGVSDLSKKSISSFRHPVYQNGKMLDREMFDLFKIIPERLGAKNIYNMICQLQLATVGKQNAITHVDMPLHKTPYYSSVYYINNSDGPTVLYDREGNVMVECHHERGKVIMFDGDIPHHASKPSTDIRCIMNFCFD